MCSGNTCNCSSDSLADSARRIGRMPVYAPFPDIHGREGFVCKIEPIAQSTLWGYWYSFPAHTPRKQSASPSPTPTSRSRCHPKSWRRTTRGSLSQVMMVHARGAVEALSSRYEDKDAPRAWLQHFEGVPRAAARAKQPGHPKCAQSAHLTLLRLLIEAFRSSRQ